MLILITFFRTFSLAQKTMFSNKNVRPPLLFQNHQPSVWATLYVNDKILGLKVFFWKFLLDFLTRYSGLFITLRPSSTELELFETT